MVTISTARHSYSSASCVMHSRSSAMVGTVGQPPTSSAWVHLLKGVCSKIGDGLPPTNLAFSRQLSEGTTNLLSCAISLLRFGAWFAPRSNEPINYWSGESDSEGR